MHCTIYECRISRLIFVGGGTQGPGTSGVTRFDAYLTKHCHNCVWNIHRSKACINTLWIGIITSQHSLNINSNQNHKKHHALAYTRIYICIYIIWIFRRISLNFLNHGIECTGEYCGFVTMVKSLYSQGYFWRICSKPTDMLLISYLHFCLKRRESGSHKYASYSEMPQEEYRNLHICIGFLIQWTISKSQVT